MQTVDRYDNTVLAYQYEYMKGRKSNNGDIEYYCNKIPINSKNVLEIGCGTGRITFALKQQGVDVVGVDIAEAMIAIARQKSLQLKLDIEFHAIDASLYSCDTRYDTILIPFNSLCFVPNNKINTFLDNMSSLLADNGRILFDFTRPLDGSYHNTSLQDADWSPALFIEELNKTIRWKIFTQVSPDRSEVQYIYSWEITTDDTVELKTSTMPFSALAMAEYKQMFSQRGISLLEVIEKPYLRDNMPEIHYFCEFQKQSNNGE